jgi:single-strand DNA-binding protein
MNSLNSILIEGKLIADPNKNDVGCTFIITSDRYYKDDKDMVKEVSYFIVEAFGRLADACMNELKRNRGVRVVGRIKQLSIDSRMTIVAGHVEFKPIIKDNK